MSLRYLVTEMIEIMTNKFEFVDKRLQLLTFPDSVPKFSLLLSLLPSICFDNENSDQKKQAPSVGLRQVLSANKTK